MKAKLALVPLNEINMKKSKFPHIVLLFILMGLFNSCVKHPQLLYFRNQTEFVPLEGHEITNQLRIKIQPDDVLFILVRALEQETAEPFNLLPSTSVGNFGNQGSNATLQGYLVDSNGNIDFPVLGKMNLADQTVEEAKLMIAEKLKPYLKDPVIMMRFLNFRYTVIGEVGNPRTVQVVGEKATILQALGEAGDLTPYSNREKILVIREQNGKREFGYVNLHSPDVFKSPYFYLQQNDVIMVEPIKEATAKVTDPVLEILPIITSALSLAALLIAIAR
ncbi:MAG: polysaccharide biosynthesis/export family protein [Saprospiraceae bacterium]|nr:polysaccharide biosynthesis/export family protein [Saprospiraceae bacterium]